MKEKSSLLLMFHGTISLAALLAISFFHGEKTAAVLEYRPAPPSHIVDIGIEHTEPTSVTLDISVLHGVAIVEVTSTDSTSESFVSVPDTWQRREVRNAAIADVTSEESAFGFTRWKLPAGATISYRVHKAPTQIIVHNPSTVPLQITTNYVDLETEVSDHNVFLLQDSSMALW